MKNIIPNSGKQVMLRDKRTGAPWLASFNYINQHYSFQPVGNLRAIKQEFESLEVLGEFEPAVHRISVTFVVTAGRSPARHETPR